MNVSSFSRRTAIGQSGEDELHDLLARLGFRVVKTGQQHWLPDAIREVIRYENSDAMVRALRYAPDLLAYRPGFPMAWWDAKVNATPGTPNFSLEKACYEEQMARTRKGERVVLAFKETDGLWHANWVQKLVIARDMSQVRHDARGSHTPFLLIRKSSTVSLSMFLKS